MQHFPYSHLFSKSVAQTYIYGVTECWGSTNQTRVPGTCLSHLLVEVSCLWRADESRRLKATSFCVNVLWGQSDPSARGMRHAFDDLMR